MTDGDLALGALLLGAARAGAAGLLLPLPWAGRIGLAALGALLTAPALLGAAAALSTWALPVLLLRELLCGATLGLCASVPLHAASVGGALLRSAWGPGAAGHLILWLAVALYMTLGGPEALLRALGLSYTVLPLGQPARLEPLILALPARLLLVGLLLGAHPAAALWLAQALVALGLRRADGDGVPPWAPPLRALLGAAALLLGNAALTAALGGELAHLPGSLGEALPSLRPPP